MRKIIVTRNDNSVREVVIWFDRATEKYAFVNLTTEHICKCRFNSIKDALLDLLNNENVVSFMFKDDTNACNSDCGECKVEYCSWHEELEWLREQQELYMQEQEKKEKEND